MKHLSAGKIEHITNGTLGHGILVMGANATERQALLKARKLILESIGGEYTVVRVVVDNSDAHRIHLPLKRTLSTECFCSSEVNHRLKMNVTREMILEDHSTLVHLLNRCLPMGRRKAARSRHNKVIKRDSLTRKADIIGQAFVDIGRRSSKGVSS